MTPTFVATTSITYFLTTVDINNCLNADSMMVIVEPAMLFIPNAFSPNEDDIDDFFSCFTKGISEIQISIYNRWGDLVFFSNETNNFWDGKHNEMFCQIGVYVYAAKAKTWGGRQIEMNGNVTRIR